MVSYGVSKRTSDEFKLSEVVRKNNGLKAGTAYYVEGNRGTLWRHCPPKTKFVASSNGWMLTPSVDVPPAPVPLTTIPASMATRANIADVAAYLKTRPVGSKCGMTAGPQTNAHLGGEFTQRGLRVSCIGPYGNRVITLVAVETKRTDQLKEYNASKRTSDEHLISSVIKRDGGIPANTPTYVQGNRTTLVRQLLNYVGKRNYSAKELKEDPRGAGWMVTVKIPIIP